MSPGSSPCDYAGYLLDVCDHVLTQRVYLRILGVDVAGNDLHGRCRELALVEDAPHAVFARLPDKLCQLFCRRFLPVGFDGNLP